EAWGLDQNEVPIWQCAVYEPDRRAEVDTIVVFGETEQHPRTGQLVDGQGHGEQARHCDDCPDHVLPLHVRRMGRKGDAAGAPRYRVESVATHAIGPTTARPAG